MTCLEFFFVVLCFTSFWFPCCFLVKIILICKNYITGPNIQDYYGDVLDLMLQMWQWCNRNDSCVSFSLVIVWMCVSGCDFHSIYVTLWCVLYFSHCLCIHSLLLIRQWQECYHVSNPCVKLCSCNIYKVSVYTGMSAIWCLAVLPVDTVRPRPVS